jgi:copper oxidase (laccase) domain-containing protein
MEWTVHLAANQPRRALLASLLAAFILCTSCDSERFFSYRRDGLTGRMAAVFMLAG